MDRMAYVSITQHCNFSRSRLEPRFLLVKIEDVAGRFPNFLYILLHHLPGHLGLHSRHFPPELPATTLNLSWFMRLSRAERSATPKKENIHGGGMFMEIGSCCL